AELVTSIEADRAAFPEVWQANQLRDRHESLRLKLTFMVARLEAVRREVASRDAQRPEFVSGAYQNSQEFIRDLELCRNVLSVANASLSRRFFLDPLLGQARTLGFSGYRLDIREDAEVHTRAIAEIAQRTGTENPDAEVL